MKIRRATSPWLVNTTAQVNNGMARKEFTIKEGILFFNNQFVLDPASTLQEVIMKELYDSKEGGHSRFFRTLERLRLRFFWKGMRNDVQDFVSHCRTCQQVKLPTAKPMGLLQPLDIPSNIWEAVSLDFVTGVLVVQGKSVIVVVMDRMSKYYHLGALSTSYTAGEVAEFFSQHVVQLHGIPKSVVSDHDKVFMSKFRLEMVAKSGTTLKMSTTFHPKIDG